MMECDYFERFTAAGPQLAGSIKKCQLRYPTGPDDVFKLIVKQNKESKPLKYLIYYRRR